MLPRTLRASGVEAIAGAPVPADWSPDVSLQLMAKYRIDAAILSVPVPLHAIDQDHSHHLAREINEFGRDVAQKFPDRFGFFACLPLPDLTRSVDEACYALDELAADGVALLTNHAGIYQGDDRRGPLYAELDERAAVCFVHPTVPVDSAGVKANGGSPLPGVQPSVLEFPFDITRAIANLMLTDTVHKFRHINDDVFLGEFVHAMHKWGASVMIICVFLHMSVNFFFGAYKYPREMTWVIGVVLLILTLTMGFTGYLLPFDQRAYWATVVGVNINSGGPLIGPFLSDFLLGGADFAATTLSRFYAIHMLIIPGAIVAFLLAQMYLVVKLGTTAPPWIKPDPPLEFTEQDPV